MATVVCPICGKSFDPGKSAAAPFCSDRCRQIDLGRWLKEGYAVPVTRHDEEDEQTDAPVDDRGPTDE